MHRVPAADGHQVFAIGILVKDEDDQDWVAFEISSQDHLMAIGSRYAPTRSALLRQGINQHLRAYQSGAFKREISGLDEELRADGLYPEVVSKLRFLRTCARKVALNIDRQRPRAP